MDSHALTRLERGPRRTRDRVATVVARADALAVRLAARPWRAFALVMALNLALAAAFVAAGLALFDDQAGLFRELAPATVLSFAELLLIAAIAWATYRRADGDRHWWSSFWGLSAVVFLVFAFDEITQSAIFVSHVLEDWFGARAAAGFYDLEAVLLTLLFAAVALVLLPRALALLRHPRALLLLGAAAALGAASQGLDSFAAPTRWEFVAEETLKLAAEAFFAGGFLVALRDVLGGAAKPSEAAEPAAQPA